MIKPKILLSCLAALCVSGTTAAVIIVGNQKDSKESSGGDGFTGTESIGNGLSNTETDGDETDTVSETGSFDGEDDFGDTTPDDEEISGAGTDSPSASPDFTPDSATDSTPDSMPDSTPDSGDDTTSDSKSDSLSDSNSGGDTSSGGEAEVSGSASDSENNQDPTPDVHEHRALGWTVAQGAKPTLSAEGQAAGECACGESLSVVLPALGPNDYTVTEGNCSNPTTYRIYVDGVGGLSTLAASETVELTFQDPGSHIVEVGGTIYTMNRDMYPMNGANSYEEAIKELVHMVATCTERGRGYFECSVCEKPIFVNTYREHEYVCTLTKVSETEFTLAWSCCEGGEEGSETLSLQTEDNPDGEVRYDGAKYQVSFDGKVYTFSKEDVE